MATDTRPTSLTFIQNYNLRNQGWPNEFACLANQPGNGSPTVTDPVQYTFDTQGFYPSNADIIYFAKATAVNDTPSLNAYSPWLLETLIVGNTPAAKGKFIINAFDRNREPVSGISNLYLPSEDSTDDRPVSTAFYAGRIWYFMPDGRLYFSQSLLSIENAPKCYQDADPTAEDINELIATDGGEIDISGISQGLKLVPIRAELALLADNGVWTISGDGDQTFSATSQEIRKITSTGVSSAESVVEAEGTIFYWSAGGVYALTGDNVTGFLQAQNITEQSIQSFYLDIPNVGRDNARGFYDEEEKKVFWLYNDTSSYDGINFRYRYNRALILDVVLGAFYTYTFDSSGDYPFVAAMAQQEAGSFSTTTEGVTDGGVPVTNVGSLLNVTIAVPNTTEVKLKFLTFAEVAAQSWKYTFSELRDNNLRDWNNYVAPGVSFDSYIETGHDIFEDLISEKEANVVYTFFKRTEQNYTEVNDVIGYDFPSSCFMRAKWAWADSAASGLWSDTQQVYRLREHWPAGSGPFDYGYEVVEGQHLVPGKGRALSIRFESEAGKDFHLLGWAVPGTLITGY